LDKDGMPRLADFGIALLTGDIRRTSADEIVGTPAYLSPEQISDDKIGPAADIYALGLVLLECLTGEVAFRRDTRMATALARLYRGPTIPSGLPRPLTRLLTTMTATDPAARPTAVQCAEALRANDTTSGLPLLDAVRPRRPATRRWSRPAVLIGAAAVALPTLVATLVLTLDGAGPTPSAGTVSHDIAGPLVQPHRTTSPPGLSPGPPAVLIVTVPAPPAASTGQPVTSVAPTQTTPASPSTATGGQPANHGKGKGKGHQ
ncbi:MAG TPA: protein kinase, partial [Nakamurella sp.]